MLSNFLIIYDIWKRNTKGPKFKHSLMDEFYLLLFKLKYQLPDRVLKRYFI